MAVYINNAGTHEQIF